jgi:hypothetical protein
MLRQPTKHKSLLVAALLATSPALAAPAAAWFTPGHAKVTRAAVRALPSEVPSFFREGAFTVGEASVDPDVFKDRTLVALRAAEEPNHYLDWELIPGLAFPPDRWAFTAAVIERRVEPRALGVLPYSLMESYQRLTLAFAEHRRFPDDVAIRQKALVYAGWLGHYAGDLEQPLHTSIHHDGRANPDKTSPHTGIHQLVDGLFERVPFDEEALLRDLPVRTFPDVWATIQTELATSHALVDRVYELEPDLRAAWPPPPRPAVTPTPATTAGGPAPPTVTPPAAPPPAAAAPTAAPRPRPISAAVTAFTKERYRATASFLASLIRTAWEQSATIQLPSWHERPQPMP